jgi:hypothetical protein
MTLNLPGCLLKGAMSLPLLHAQMLRLNRQCVDFSLPWSSQARSSTSTPHNTVNGVVDLLHYAGQRPVAHSTGFIVQPNRRNPVLISCSHTLQVCSSLSRPVVS